MNHESICENIAGQGCGLKKVLNIIGGKWKILLLCVIDDKGVMRYGELPVRVEYSLTEKAHSMIPILLELKHWGEKHL